MRIYIIIIVIVLCFDKATSQTHFVRIPAKDSGLNFTNQIIENKHFNSFTYPYMYNGAGVAAGDLNNDGLTDLFFSSNLLPNKLFLNKGNMKFEDISVASGINTESGFFTGVTMVDINNDGYLDIYICKSVEDSAVNRKNVLYINNGNLTFTNKAKEYGLDDASYSTQAYFNDMDLDGDVDLFLLNYPYNMGYANKIVVVKKGDQLVADEDTSREDVSYRYYENFNGFFKDRTFAAGLGSYAFGLSAIIDDFNEDGYPDIYTCNDFFKPDYLYINNKNGTFTNRLEEYFSHISNNSMGSDYADINNDGNPDLIVVDMISESLARQKRLRGPGNYDHFQKMVDFGYSHQYLKNVLQLNNGNKTYSDISYYAGVTFTEWSWAPILADFDNDGLKDLFITNGLLHDVTDMDFSMYKSDSIKKVLFATKSIEDAMMVIKDFPSIKVNNLLYHNNGQLGFENLESRSGITEPSWSNGAVAADLDNDGDLDLVTNNINEEAFLYKNNAIENKTGNYIRFKINGSAKNKDGFFTLVEIESIDGKKKQMHRYYPTRGYLSSHEPFIHFGVSTYESVNVKVTWPDKKTQEIKNLPCNKIHSLNYADAVIKPETPKTVATTVMKDITESTKINYLQKESSYIDFKLEPLLPHQFSKMGPCLSVGDINNDKMDDVFIGGSSNISGAIYIQKQNGTFSIQEQPDLIKDKKYEDTGSSIFDADNDGDNDLLVVSGGNETPDDPSLYIARLYLNNGKGILNRNTSFPEVRTSGKAIAVGDFDNDGWKDIYIGGRVIPGHYGRTPSSFLLKNNKGIFVDVTSLTPSLQKPGMITDAVWSDNDGDGWKELILVGEWMPLTIFKNKNGVLYNTAEQMNKTYGWWNTIIAVDIDNDGDEDLISGNEGVNSRYKIQDTAEIRMMVNDFDRNGSTDCVISLFEDGNYYPVALRDMLLDQMNFLKKRFLRYRDYSLTTTDDIFTKEELEGTTYLKADFMKSTCFMNDGKGNYTVSVLPLRSQLSPVNAIITDDIDKDGKTDLLIAGNNYSTQVENGRSDAGIGLMLRNAGGGNFRSVPVTLSGFYVPGDVKCMKKITIAGKICFIAGKNSGKVQVIGYN